jgi:FADH2 O2-dependent halogenase
MAGARNDFDYDITILGSGMAGGILALCCRSMGLRVLLVEKGDHPRFAIGESVTGEALRRLDFLAGHFDVPLLRDLSSYPRIKRAGLPVATWPKSHVTFVQHTVGRKVSAEHPEEIVLQASTWPIGPDAHLYRADIDLFLKDKAVEAGADYLPHTEPLSFAFDPARGAALELRSAEGERIRTVHSRLVIDATGPQRWLARHLGIDRVDSEQVPMASSSVYAHLRGVKRWEDVLGARPMVLPRDHGTLLHCGASGVFWVIPFDNGITSVGWVSTQPLPADAEPEQIFRDALAAYPSLAEQMSEATPVGPVRRADRLQYSTSKVAGDGWFLLPGSAEFSDPLFSVGIPLTLAGVSRILLRIEQADRSRPITERDMAGLEETFRLESAYIRKFTIASKRCFYDFDLTRLAIWLNRLVIFREGAYIDGSSAEAATAAAWGAEDRSIREVVDAFYDFVADIDLDQPIQEATKRRLQEIIAAGDADGFLSTSFGRMREDGIYVNSLPRMIDFCLRTRRHPLGLGKVGGLLQISRRWFRGFLPDRGPKAGPARRPDPQVLPAQLKSLVYP